MKPRKFALAASFAVVVGAAACSSAPSTSVNGTVAGSTLAAQDAIFADMTGASTTGTVLGITSARAFCDDVTKNQLPKNAVGLSIQLVSNGGVVTAPGTFNLLGTSSGTAFFGAAWDALDATCNSTTTHATAGTVTVTSISASQLTGTFDITFGSDHVSGSFDASSCAALSQATGAPTCI